MSRYIERFRDEDCSCDHPAGAHDAGFGCTEEGCTCLADWEFEEVP